jgi:hypothetical protein
MDEKRKAADVTRSPKVELAFRVAREYQDPRILDGLRILCNAIKTGPRVVRTIVRTAGNGSGVKGTVVVGGSSFGVGAADEIIEWILEKGFPAHLYPFANEFINLPAIEAAITGIIASVPILLARGFRR